VGRQNPQQFNTGIRAPTCSDPATAQLEKCDVVFFATPNGVAMEQARHCSKAGVRVIDIAAIFA